MKKFASILLAFLLALTLSLTAFADNETGTTTDTTTGSTITVKGTVKDATYTLYKIFDVTEVNGIAAYSIPSGKTEEGYKSIADSTNNNFKNFDSSLGELSSTL